MGVEEHIDEFYEGTGRWDDRYGALLLLILATMLLTAANTGWLEITAFLVLGGTVLFALLVSRAGLRTWRLAVILIPLAVILGIVGRLGDARGPRLIAAIVSFILPIVAIGALIRRMITDRAVSSRTILGLLCVYLLIGVAFAALYSTISIASQEPFFVQTHHALPVDYTYFSFVTLATVGYGDFTAANPLPRMLTAIEGLSGQLYLVTVVAVAVSHWVRRDRDGSSET